MITFGTLGLSLSPAVARALLAFAHDDVTRVNLAAVGIDEGDVCATDGQAAVRFQRCDIDAGAAPPTRWNGRYFRRAKVEAAIKAAGRKGAVVLLWSELEPAEGPRYAQLSKVEPGNYVRDDDLPIGWDTGLLGRLDVAAKACRRERQEGESATDFIPTPPAMLVSLGGHLDPCRYEIGGESWGTAVHTAYVTIMPMNMRARGQSQDERAVEKARDRALAKREAEQAKLARQAKNAPGVLPPAPEGCDEDAAARTELERLSSAKLSEPWKGRHAQRQVLSNILRGREVTREQREAIAAGMVGKPLSDLRFAVASILGRQVAA